ncbi:MAG: TldD/PmbA family protein [Elusimicrobia bacterium]|nr:TldD/PmbA family protein [Elusimicrobiota bacterium]
MGVISWVIFLFNLNAFSSDNTDILLRAMKTELDVSYERLRDAEKFPLYFMGYEVWDYSGWWVDSNLGGITSENKNNNRVMVCDMRIGSRELDSTHEIKSDSSEDDNSKKTDISFLALNDYDAIRMDIWELTDKTYKKALNRYIKVLTNKQVSAENDDKSGDFTLDKTTDVFYQKVTEENINEEGIKELIKRMSLKFKKYDFIINSSVNFSKDNVTRYIVNSDGAQIVEGRRKYQLSYYVYSKNDDGTDLSRFKRYDFSSISDMPAEKDISLDIDKSISELKELLVAENLEPYSGPAILENKAAAVFWHEILGHRLEGHRQKSDKEGQTFAKKVGQKIMPEFLTVYDDPNLESYGGIYLNGHYLYDDEGVRSRKTLLIDNGVLKNFLMQRSPLLNFNYSNAHGRRSSGYMSVARQGNLIVSSSKTVSYDDLKKMLLDEINKSKKPYGLIISDIEGGFTITRRNMPQSYTILIKYAKKIYPDGREEVVRGLNMIGTPVETFSKIVATGDDYDIFNGVCGAESGWVDVSAVSPSLLFSSIETEKVNKSNQKPPVLKPPYIGEDRTQDKENTLFN